MEDAIPRSAPSAPSGPSTPSGPWTRSAPSTSSAWLALCAAVLVVLAAGTAAAVPTVATVPAVPGVPAGRPAGTTGPMGPAGPAGPAAPHAAATPCDALPTALCGVVPRLVPVVQRLEPCPRPGLAVDDVCYSVRFDPRVKARSVLPGPHRAVATAHDHAYAACTFLSPLSPGCSGEGWGNSHWAAPGGTVCEEVEGRLFWAGFLLARTQTDRCLSLPPPGPASGT